MNNTASFAKRELDILVASKPDPDNRPLVEPFIPELIALAQKFGDSGQSGGSAPYTANAICQTLKRILMQEPVCPITGMDEEWTDMSSASDGEVIYQNNRCHALFKVGKEGTPYYLDAIVWRTQLGATWTGSAQGADAEKFTSRQYIKGFPFVPKTFVVDVREHEVEKDSWEFFIKNPTQLTEVFKYYDRFE